MASRVMYSVVEKRTDFPRNTNRVAQNLRFRVVKHSV